MLNDELFQRLNEVWNNYYDKHIVHLHQLIARTGSIPSEALKLLWEDINLPMRTFTKRDTKRGKSLVFRMNQKVRAILEAQQALLDNSVESMQFSKFVFSEPPCEQRKLESYLNHFR